MSSEDMGILLPDNEQVSEPYCPSVSRTHQLKCWPHYFDEIACGRKTFDVRSTEDRCFQAGDLLELFRWDPEIPRDCEPGTGLLAHVVAVYHGLPGVYPGYAVLAIKLLPGQMRALS